MIFVCGDHGWCFCVWCFVSCSLWGNICCFDFYVSFLFGILCVAVGCCFLCGNICLFISFMVCCVCSRCVFVSCFLCVCGMIEYVSVSLWAIGVL